MTTGSAFKSRLEKEWNFYGITPLKEFALNYRLLVPCHLSGTLINVNSLIDLDLKSTNLAFLKQ